MPKDYYQILGLEKSATAEDVKRAYRKLAHQHHPDKGGEAERFKEINEAYQVLGNQEKRQQYDQYGQTFEGAGGNGQNPFGQQGFDVNFEDFGNFNDIFSQFFGGASYGGRQRSRGKMRVKGADLQIDMAIDFKEMVFGTKRELTLNRFRTCPRCKGNTAEPGTKIVSCKKCGGSGFTRTQTRTFLGSIVQEHPCAECRGEGKTAEKLCAECRGEGRTRQMETLVVKIPAGIETGTRLRIAGEGEAPPYGGDQGDLYVLISVREDKRFVRDGFDLLTKQGIPFSVAALGGKIKVETIDGGVDLSIPKATSSGTEFRVKEKGVARGQRGDSGKRGDQVVTVFVDVPKKLTKKQEQILKEFEEAGKKGTFSFF